MAVVAAVAVVGVWPREFWYELIDEQGREGKIKF